MQLSWHPSKENLLAYGTDDGRVGIYDILSSRFVHSLHKTEISLNVWQTEVNDKYLNSCSVKHQCRTDIIHLILMLLMLV